MAGGSSSFLTNPSGSMMWIWQLSECEGGNLDAIIAKAKANNITTLAIKAFDGEWRWTHQFSADIVKRVHDAGLSVAGWWYSVGDWTGPVVDAPGSDYHNCTVEAELDNLEWMISCGVDFGIIDPEKEWCYVPGQRNDPTAHAERYLSQMRQRIGTSFPIYAGIVPSDSGYWYGNPLEVLAKYCDGTTPQTYCWMWFVEDSVEDWIQRGIRFSYGKPCYPILDTYSFARGEAPASYLVRAGNYARSIGLKGVSFWDWQHTQLGRTWQGVGEVSGLFASTASPELPLPFEPNPHGFDVGPGMLAELRKRHLVAITNEQFFKPSEGQAPGLAKRSFLWTESGEMLVAFQLLDKDNNPRAEWGVRVIREV